MTMGQNENMNIQQRMLGAIPLSPDILNKANIGLWAFELDEGKEPRMYVDDTMLGLLGLEHQVSPEETYHAWYDHIDESSYGIVEEAVAKMNGEHAEVQYPWHHPNGHTMIVRCGGVRNPDYTAGLRIEGTHQNVTEVLHFDEEAAERYRRAEEQLKHEQLRAEVLNYMIDNDDDPIELLKNFAKRLRELINCDQVIYRDLEETRIMVNSPAIEHTWSVPIEFCMQCEHFDAHHPMYAGGYTEMENCQEGWQGIPVYHECPIKSSLTRIVYCDGEIAGYLAIHYVQNYHTFSDLERATLEEFTRILSISLSRYASKLKSSELEGVKRTMNMIFSLSDKYDPIIVIEPETGEYDWYMNKAQEVEDNTSMKLHGDDIYKSIVIDGNTIIHEEDREQFLDFYSRENILKIAETGETREIENRWFLETENRYCWKYNKAVRMTDENGKVSVVVGVVDVTDEKEKEEEFEAQSEKIAQQSAFNNYFLESYTSAYYINLDTRSAVVVKQSGHLAEEAPVIDDFYEAMQEYSVRTAIPNDRDELLRIVNPDKISEILKTHNEYSFTFRDVYEGRERVMCCRIIRAEEENHAAVGFIDITQEFAQEQERQQELQEALSMAQSANRAKTTFLNSMSHDIRTPMNAIIGYTGLATSHIDDKERVKDYLEKIDQASGHLLSLINDVLDMSRIESGKMNLEEKEEKITDIASEIQNIVQADINNKKLDFFMDVEKITNDYVFCDKLRLNQIILNVLSNSIKYTNSGGRIIMRVMEEESDKEDYGSYIFSVEDTGMGMDKEFLAQIFDPFTRVKSSTVSGIQGTGLGMSITKNIVDMMGGTIDIVSEPGTGTEVTLKFSFKLQKFPTIPSPVEVLDYHFDGKKVLLVEDNELNREIAVEYLKDYGFITDVAEDGYIAVEKLRNASREDYDIVLMDIQMPVMDGYEATRIIRDFDSEISQIPILAMTANAFEEDRKLALEAGMNEHITKPIEMDKIWNILARFV